MTKQLKDIKEIVKEVEDKHKADAKKNRGLPAVETKFKGNMDKTVKEITNLETTNGGWTNPL